VVEQEPGVFVVALACDPLRDVFQVGRGVTGGNDFVVHGAVHANKEGCAAGPVSRYACRIECERLAPFRVFVLAGGFHPVTQVGRTHTMHTRERTDITALRRCVPTEHCRPTRLHALSAPTSPPSATGRRGRFHHVRCPHLATGSGPVGRGISQGPHLPAAQTTHRSTAAASGYRMGQPADRRDHHRHWRRVPIVPLPCSHGQNSGGEPPGTS
jgi:hypothetical protein